MNKQEFLRFHAEFCQRMTDITKRKSADYTGDSDDPFANFRVVEKLGICDTRTGFLVRMADKLQRMVNLADGRDPAVADESLADTTHDLANYCALFAGYLESQRMFAQEVEQAIRATEHLADINTAEYLGHIPEIEIEYEIIARSDLSGKEFLIERVPDLTFAQHRLEQQREAWPTFKLTIREVKYEHTSAS